MTLSRDEKSAPLPFKALFINDSDFPNISANFFCVIFILDKNFLKSSYGLLLFT